MSGPTLFVLSSVIRQPAHSGLSTPLCRPWNLHSSGAGDGPQSHWAGGQGEEVGDQAAGSSGRSLQLDPGLDSGVLEFSLKILELQKFWTLGARDGVYPLAQFTAGDCHSSVSHPPFQHPPPPSHQHGGSLPMC